MKHLTPFLLIVCWAVVLTLLGMYVIAPQMPCDPRSALPWVKCAP